MISNIGLQKRNKNFIFVRFLSPSLFLFLALQSVIDYVIYTHLAFSIFIVSKKNGFIMNYIIVCQGNSYNCYPIIWFRG